jgi:hypothetical protein
VIAALCIIAEKSLTITLTFLLQLVILVIVANPVIIAYKSAVLALRARQHGPARHCELRQNLEHCCGVSKRAASTNLLGTASSFWRKKRRKTKIVFGVT